MKEPKNGMMYDTSKANYQPLKTEVMIMFIPTGFTACWGILCISSNDKPVLQGHKCGLNIFTTEFLNTIYDFQAWVEIPNVKIQFNPTI